MIGHGALYHIKYHFRFQDMSHYELIELILLGVPLRVMMPMAVVSSASQVIPSEMMTPLRLAMYYCTMMM